MFSTVKEQFIKVAEHIPGLHFHRHTMAEPAPFKATDNFNHRYADPEVLKRALIEIGFTEDEIKIKATEANGLDVELPRELTKEQKKNINQKFVDAKNASRAPPKTPDDDEDE
ncbi:hypothetical protein GGR55DRAFT_655547 [Xylaria sp. FL0064]|nr:hypothetical protein GGR55DRAFT_655547 [Xylaria sp. FL0064]